MDNAAVFGLPADYLGNNARLRFENDTPLQDSDGHAVLFRQQFGDLAAVKDGSVIVGLTGSAEGGWDVVYVSSSLSENTGIAATGTRLTGKQAWLQAANGAGQSDPDADPANNSNCPSGSDQDEVVRAAELQVFGR
ncbi:MAG TPA: hypothetical protein VKA73_12145 [Rubrobacter sp.]|nr:hypothetical protein [Rubrobacter sp.]